MDPSEEAADIATTLKPRKTVAKKSRKAKRGASKYDDYKPTRFKRHPVARMLNPTLEAMWGGEPAKEEVGEAWTAAAYWGFGLPAYTEREGDGHPYVVAAERTGRWVWPRMKNSGTIALLKAWVLNKRGGQA